MTSLIDMVTMDENAKKVFMAMPREEQLFAILGMLSFLRSEVAVLKKNGIDTNADIKKLKDDQRHFRLVRERREKEIQDGINNVIKSSNLPQIVIDDATDDTNTTQKIVAEITKAFASRFDFWIWFRDKILPTLLITIILGILYLVFGR